jgi:acetyltransferase EpsM
VSGARLVLIGGGEHARVLGEAARAADPPFELAGFIDPAPCDETAARLGVPRLGGDDALNAYRDAVAVLAIGALGPGPARERLAARLDGAVAGWATVVHGRAWVSPTAALAPGAVVFAGAVVHTGARIGRHCVVNSGAIVEHDVAVEDFALISPGVTIGGGARIGRGAFVGLGAVVRDHVRIGPDAFVAMGAVVVRDVPAGARVMGVPAAPPPARRT